MMNLFRPSRRLVLLAGLFASMIVGPVLADDAFPLADKLPSIAKLPDPLISRDGTRVTTLAAWQTKRSDELRNLIQHYMYGYLPATEKVTGEVVFEDTKALDGKATLRDITLKIGGEGAPPVHLLLMIPNDGKKSHPIFVGMNFAGNHAAINHPKVRINPNWIYPNYPGTKDNHALEASRGTQADVWAIDQTIARGYAIALVYSGDFDPDRKEERGGFQPYLRKKLGTHTDRDFGTIAVWAWGMSNVVTYVSDLPEIDASKIAVVGHSRLGKTALLAGAMDPRIGVVISHQAGCGGSAPSRGKIGEPVERINTAFPHWFNGNFKQFNKTPEKLPFDQNGLAALVAPRSLLFSNAVEDTWANPDGQLEVLKAADSVWRLYGLSGIAADAKAENQKLIGDRLGYFLRPGKHSMTREDWTAFLDFADREFAQKRTSGN